MPNPTLNDVHVDRPLTNISIAYMQNPAGFVADTVFPGVPVQKRSDRYFRYDRSDFFRNQMQKRAPGDESAGSGFKLKNNDTYFCEKWALHKDIDDDTRANTDDPLNMDRDATLFLSQQALINREVNWASKYFTTAVWSGVTGSTGTDVTGESTTPSTNQVLQWNDSHSTPIEDIRFYNTSIHSRTGYRANKLVIGRQVWDKLADHPEIVDRIKYGASPGAPAIITRRAVAALMELDDILVMDGIYNTGAEEASFEGGLAGTFIGGKAALLVYAAPGPSLMQPSGGYTFNWVGLMGAGGMGQRMKTFRIEPRESDRLEIEQAYDQNLIASDMGVFFTAIVA
jgi:hypothetical protein